MCLQSADAMLWKHKKMSNLMGHLILCLRSKQFYTLTVWFGQKNSIVQCVVQCRAVYVLAEGLVNEFSEKSQTAFDPPPSFLENHVAIFYNGYGRIHARGNKPDSIS